MKYIDTGRMIVRYKKSKLLTDQGSEYKFAWRTFCTWDYSITSRQGVIDHRTSLRTDLKVCTLFFMALTCFSLVFHL